MNLNKPTASLKLRHISFYVQDINAALSFYQGVLGMIVYYHPDDSNVYLTNGDDVIALHQTNNRTLSRDHHFDHLGFFVADSLSLWDWYVYLTDKGIVCPKPKKHGDGCEGFYAFDPDGNTVEFTTVPKRLIP